MITIALQGGIGNQLFQWAFGQAFNHRGFDVQYETSLFDYDPGRKYMLDKVGLRLPLVHHGGKGPIVREGSLRYKRGILDDPEESIYIGYWQCEKYFNDLDLRDEILWPKLSQPTEEMSNRIDAEDNRSCFVHVRRSDNLRTAGIAVHGLLSAPDCRYYERAMSAMRERVRHVHFYVFSDDSAWCKANLCFPDVTVVDHNCPSFTVDENHDIHWKEGGKEVEDLYLMSLCRHAIIANSSFSWWGAWLGDDVPSRFVFAPDRWFASNELDASDIVPDRWMKIAVR